MFGDCAPYKLCLALCQSVDDDESGSMFAVANAYLCFTIALEYVNVRWFVIVWPNNESKAIDEKDGWHYLIIPIRLGYSI